MNSSSVVETAAQRFGNMFYLVPWWKMPVDNSNLKEVTYLEDAIPMFFVLMFIELVVGLIRVGSNVYRANDTFASIILGDMQLLSLFYLKSADVFIYIYIWENYRFADLRPGSWYDWLIAFLAFDFMYYWFHRHAHEFHVLWTGHSVHHSGEDYNLATALRQGIVQGFTGWIWKLPCALFISPISFLGHSQLNTIYQFWIHTALVGSLGYLEYIFNTPSHHRMHHRPPGNRNYAGVLIIWDKMFGTFVPEDEQKDYYGLAKQYETFDPLNANIEHLTRITANIKSEAKHGMSYYFELLTKRRIKHKSIFDPFALFRPVKAAKGNLWEMPTRALRMKYNGHADSHSFFVKLNSIFMFFCALGSTVYCLMKAFPSRDFSSFAIHSLIFCSVLLNWCAGRLLDGFSRAFYPQTFRILLFALFSLTTDLSSRFPSEVSNGFNLFMKADALLWFLSCCEASLGWNKKPSTKVE